MKYRKEFYRRHASDIKNVEIGYDGNKFFKVIAHTAQ